MKRECTCTQIFTRSGSYVGKKTVMNDLDTNEEKKILHELEYDSVYEKKNKEKMFQRVEVIRGDDRIIRYDFVVSCPKIYGTL